jgi:hypothetical protein
MRLEHKLGAAADDPTRIVSPSESASLLAEEPRDLSAPLDLRAAELTRFGSLQRPALFLRPACPDGRRGQICGTSRICSTHPVKQFSTYLIENKRSAPSQGDTLFQYSLRFSNRHGLGGFCARSNPHTKRAAAKFYSENKTGGECQRHPPPGVGGVCCRYPVRDFGVPAPGLLGKPAFSRCHVSLILITLQL